MAKQAQEDNRLKEISKREDEKAAKIADQNTKEEEQRKRE